MVSQNKQEKDRNNEGFYQGLNISEEQKHKKNNLEIIILNFNIMKIKNILKEGYTVAVLAGLTAFVVVLYNAVINL